MNTADIHLTTLQKKHCWDTSDHLQSMKSDEIHLTTVQKFKLLRYICKLKKIKLHPTTLQKKHCWDTSEHSTKNEHCLDTSDNSTINVHCWVLIHQLLKAKFGWWIIIFLVFGGNGTDLVDHLIDQIKRRLSVHLQNGQNQICGIS